MDKNSPSVRKKFDNLVNSPFIRALTIGLIIALVIILFF